MLITDTIVDFKDGNDDYADEISIIDDGDWTNLATTSNNGSPLGSGFFDNIPAGGDWRNFEFVMAEGGGGDNSSLYWSGNPGFEVLPDQGVAVDQNGHRVPADSLRVQGLAPIDTADRVADLSNSLIVFDVEVAELEWDKLAMATPQPIAGNPDATLTGIVTFEGGVVRLELTEDPVPGMVVDLIDNDFIDQIVGPAGFEFSHGHPAMWDTTQFTINGQITFGGGAMAQAGDYDGDGFVGQGDIDLVLLNWGADVTGDPPNGWVTNLPGGNVDQDELDAVLLNWGEGSQGLGQAGVPEPSTIFMLLIAAGFGIGLIRRKR